MIYAFRKSIVVIGLPFGGISFCWLAKMKARPGYSKEWDAPHRLIFTAFGHRGVLPLW